MEQAVDIGRKGANIVDVGVFGEKATVDLGLVKDRVLSLIGTLMYQEKDYIEAMELMKSDKMFLKPLLTKYFNFDDYMKAYEYIDNSKGNYMKVMIKINE